MSFGELTVRNPGATWFLPSNDEWYKAAYHQPAAQGGDSDDYWLYPTRSNAAPYSDQPPGTASPTNSANYYNDDAVANGFNDGYAVTGQATHDSLAVYLTDVGAYALSTSYYGTLDQGGNVQEWAEGQVPPHDPFGTSMRVFGLAGGSAYPNFEASFLAATGFREFSPPEFDGYGDVGFRVATVVPEPSTLLLAACGMLGLLVWRRVRSSRRASSTFVHLFAGAAWLLSGSTAGAVTIPVTDNFDGGFQQTWVFVDEAGNAPPDATTISTAADDLRILSAPPPFDLAVFGILGYGNAAFEFTDAVVRATVFTLEDTPRIAGGTGRSDNDIGVVLRFDPIQGASYTLIVDFVAATLTLSHIDAGEAIAEDLAIESIPDFDPAIPYTLELSATGPVLTGRVFDGATLLATVGAVNGALASGYAAVGAAINNNAPTTYLGAGFDDFSVVPEPSTLVPAACAALGLLLAAGRGKRTAPSTLVLGGCGAIGLLLIARSRKRATYCVLLTGLLVVLATTEARAVKIGVMGSSISDEYSEESYSYATNWTMQLVDHRGVDMGTYGSWGGPRRDGYEYNWARSGDDTGELLSHGQHTGLAAQVVPEGIDYAVMLMPANDQISGSPSAYASIYADLYSPAQVTTWIDGIVNNIDTALATVAATGVKLVLVNPGDYGYAPAVQALATDPVGRQRVADAIVELNGALDDLAADYQIPYIDAYAATKAIFGPHASLNTTFEVGNVDIFLQASDTPTGTDPTAGFVHDGGHPNSVLQGLTANLIMESLNIGYGAGFTLFSEEEILGFAGIAYGGSDTVDAQIGPYSDYIINHVPEPSTFVLAGCGAVGWLLVARHRYRGRKRAAV
jgi:hypothetical protein